MKTFSLPLDSSDSPKSKMKLCGFTNYFRHHPIFPARLFLVTQRAAFFPPKCKTSAPKCGNEIINHPPFSHQLADWWLSGGGGVEGGQPRFCIWVQSRESAVLVSMGAIQSFAGPTYFSMDGEFLEKCPCQILWGFGHHMLGKSVLGVPCMDCDVRIPFGTLDKPISDSFRNPLSHKSR